MPKPVQLTATDREFLPASLEILVTPPSPIARALLLTICGLFVLALAWSYFGWIDIYAVAPGKFQPIGGSKVVQPLEPGIGHRHSRRERQPRECRRRAARARSHRDGGRPRSAGARPRSGERRGRRDARWRLPRPAPRRSNRCRSSSQRTSASRCATAKKACLLPILLSCAQASPVSRLSSPRSWRPRNGLVATIAAREKLIALAKERVDMRQRLDAMGSGSRAQTIESLQQLATQITTDTGDRGQLIETDAAMRSLERKSEEAVAQFIADQSQKLAEVEQKRDHLEQELIKAQSKADRTELKAPIAGTVQQLAVSSLGQVVASGQSLLTHRAARRFDRGPGDDRQPGHRLCRGRAAGGGQGRRLSRSPATAPSTASLRRCRATRSTSAMRPF